MNKELENLINITLEKGTITSKEKEIILKKAQKVGEEPDEIEMIIDNKLLSTKQKAKSPPSFSTTVTEKINYRKTDGDFPIPLWVGWLINALSWVLFLLTFNHAIEFIMGTLCLGVVYVAYKHNQLNTTAPFEMDRLSAMNLIYTSAFDVIWMYAWALGLFGNFNFF